jgi:hypothetical protein
MKETYFKARVPAALHEAACGRAGRQGLRLGTYLREAIERDLQLLAAPVAQSQTPSIDHETALLLQEMRLLLREIAMHANAQIVGRVFAQLDAQTRNVNKN